MASISLRKKGPGFRSPKKIWVQTEDGTAWFDVPNRQTISTERFKHFVTELPSGAKVVPKPPFTQHSHEELAKLNAMRAGIAEIFEPEKRNGVGYLSIMKVLDHPTLSFKDKLKKSNALRKQFKAAIHENRAAMLEHIPISDVHISGEGPKVGARTAVHVPASTLRGMSPDEAIDAVKRGLDKSKVDRALDNDPRSAGAALEIKAWLDVNRNAQHLQANECSRLHKLNECITNTLGSGVVMELTHTFVVKHDWLAAFGDSLGEVGDDELRIPFPCSAFEFKVASRPVTVICYDLNQIRNQGEGIAFQYFIEAPNGFWVPMSDKLGEYGFMKYLRAQVKAICVMLDAKAAEYSTVPAPAKLNAKRAKEGKPPLLDYHVIDLAVRFRRAGTSAPAMPTGRRQRCHMRRGHWLHADERPRVDAHRLEGMQRWEPTSQGRWRTWVNWYMAGDPDLGFVDKEYRL